MNSITLELQSGINLFLLCVGFIHGILSYNRKVTNMDDYRQKMTTVSKDLEKEFLYTDHGNIKIV